MSKRSEKIITGVNFAGKTKPDHDADVSVEEVLRIIVHNLGSIPIARHHLSWLSSVKGDW